MVSNRRDQNTFCVSYIFCPPKFEKDTGEFVNLFKEVTGKAAQFASDNATTLLTAGGVVGVVATALLSGRAGYKLAKVEESKKWDIYDDAYDHENHEEGVKLNEIVVPKKDLILAVAPDLIYPVFTGSATIGAIIFSNRISAKEAAALAAAYGLAERNLSEYKAKVQEKLTGQKATQINDELAQDAVDRDPGDEKIVIIDGEILCYDKTGGRYIRSTVEDIKQAVNTINAEIIAHGFAEASSFYQELGVPATPWSNSVGFDMTNMVELEYSTAMKGGRPCFVFSFKNLPRTEFGPKYSD